MKYLKSFNRSLQKFRRDNKLSLDDVAGYCGVDRSVVDAWESENDSKRCYPSLDNLLDLCIKTSSALEHFIDIVPEEGVDQMELPGLALLEDSDLSESLEELSNELSRLIPTDEEQELLRRFRKSDEENRALIIQLMNH